MQAVSRFAAIVVITMAVVGCGGDSDDGCPPSDADTTTIYRGNAARTGEELGPGPNGDAVLKGRFDLGVRNHGAPVVATGRVFIAVGADPVTAETMFSVEALTAKEGVRLTKPGRYAYAAPAIAGSVAYIVGDDLRAIDLAKREECWHANIDDGTGSSPVVIDGVVYVSDSSGLHAFDARTGKGRAWRGAAIARPGQMTSAPAVADGMVFVGVGNTLLAFDAETGGELWPYESVAPITGPPAVSNGVVYFSNGVYLYAVDANTGVEQWPEVSLSNPESFGSGGFETVAVSDGLVFAVAYGRELLAVEAESGKEVWRYRIPEAVGIPFDQANDIIEEDSVVVAGGVVYVTGSPSIHEVSGHVFALDASTGAQLWRFQTGGRCPSAPTIQGDTIYVSCSDGFLYAIGGTLAPEVATPAAS